MLFKAPKIVDIVQALTTSRDFRKAITEDILYEVNINEKLGF